jgi:hypothetical protein
MSAPILLGVGLVAAGGAYLLLRQQRAAAADPCAGITDAQAKAECEAAQALAAGLRATSNAVAGYGSKLLGNIVGDTSDFNPGNVKLNGAATWFDGALVDANGGSCLRHTQDGKYVASYANGCEPYEGAAGWAKCVKGTRPMVRGNCAVNGKHVDGLMSGDPATDPATFRWDERVLKKTSATTFPAKVPAGGTAWVVRGKAVACAAGSEVRGRDHTGGSPCVASYGTGAGQAPPPVPPPVVFGNAISGPRRR